MATLESDPAPPTPVHRIPLLAVLAALLAALAPAPAAGQGAPTDAADLSVYLVTIGQGDQVWEKFGHNGIWIHDPVAGTDRVYHYGLFDFNSPGYWGRFLRGHWIYQMGVDEMEQWLYAYRYFDRSIVAQELELSAAEKAELREFLEWNARPENVDYRYDYFRDNCSTRVRDALDRVLGGRLRAATADVPSGTTFRWHSRRLIADDLPAYAGMNAGLGPSADQEISRWEEMFLPGKLHDRVRELGIVRSERVLYRAATRGPERAAPPSWIPGFLAAGLAIAALLAGLARVSRFGFAAVSALFSLLVGTGGLLLVALWTLTDHRIAWRNENLFHFDPLALGLVVLVPALAYGARWAARPARLLAITVAALSVAGFLLQALPGLYQTNGEVIALLLPGHLAMAWAVDRLGKRYEVKGKS